VAPPRQLAVVVGGRRSPGYLTIVKLSNRGVELWPDALAMDLAFGRLLRKAERHGVGQLDRDRCPRPCSTAQAPDGRGVSTRRAVAPYEHGLSVR
jgi:hypothetical protein